MNILDKLAAHAKKRCDEAKEYISLEELRKLAAATPKGSFEFEKALRNRKGSEKSGNLVHLRVQKGLTFKGTYRARLSLSKNR